jgi:hypothetical protein
LSTQDLSVIAQIGASGERAENRIVDRHLRP